MSNQRVCKHFLFHFLEVEYIIETRSSVFQILLIAGSLEPVEAIQTMRVFIGVVGLAKKATQDFGAVLRRFHEENKKPFHIISTSPPVPLFTFTPITVCTSSSES